MKHAENLIKDLISKDERIAHKAAVELIDTKNIKAFELLCDKLEFLYDFIKANIARRIKDSTSKVNYQNLPEFFVYHKSDSDQILIDALLKFANEDFTDRIYEILQSGNEHQKTYCAKYFQAIPDTISKELLEQTALSDYEPLSINSILALEAMDGQQSIKQKAIKILQDNDKTVENSDFLKLKAVKILNILNDKKDIELILDVMQSSIMSENIASEVAYLDSMCEIISKFGLKGLVCFDNIINGFSEILPLNNIFVYQIYEVLNMLMQKRVDNELEFVISGILLKSFYKFNMITENDVYYYDEIKEVKNEIFRIRDFLNHKGRAFWQRMEDIILENIVSLSKDFNENYVVTLIELLGSFEDKIKVAQKLELLIDHSNRGLVLVKSFEILNSLVSINKDLYKNILMERIEDENLRMIVSQYF